MPVGSFLSRADAWAVAVMFFVIHTTVIGSVFGCLSGCTEVPDRGGLRHKIAAQAVDALSDGRDNWFYNMSALTFYFYHMEMAAG